MMVGAPAAIATHAEAQRLTPDPAAERAFEAFVKATRMRSPYQSRTTLVVEAIEGEQSRAAPAVEALLRFDPRSVPRRAAVQISGFDVLVSGGRLIVTHASNPQEYVAMDDDGEPYYALLVAFMDLPYPHLGILLGDEDPGVLLSQLSSRAGWVVPTRVESLEADAEAGTPARLLLELASEFESMKFELDPLTQGIRSMVLDITGGPMVRPGAALRLTLTCEESELGADEARAAFEFDPGDRRRVDSILALPRLSGDGGGGGGRGAPSRVGTPAPDIGVPRFDDGDFDSANYRGRKVMVIDFWATWCAPCRAMLPQLDAAAREMAEKGWPVVVAAINTLEGAQGEALRRKVGAFWRDANYSMVLAIDEKSEAAEAFGVRGLPHTFVVGMDGTIVWEHVGASEHFGRRLVEAVEKALGPRVEAGPEGP